MMTLSVDEALQSLSIAEGLPEAVIMQLTASASLENVSAGTILFREGVEHDAFSVIIGGHVGLEMNVPGRGGVRILSLGAGDILAWSALLASGRMTASAVTMSDVQLLTFRGSELCRLCESNHELGFHLMSRVAAALSRRLLATRLQLLDLFSTRPPLVASAPGK